MQNSGFWLCWLLRKMHQIWKVAAKRFLEREVLFEDPLIFCNFFDWENLIFFEVLEIVIKLESSTNVYQKISSSKRNRFLKQFIAFWQSTLEKIEKISRNMQIRVKYATHIQFFSFFCRICYAYKCHPRLQPDPKPVMFYFLQTSRVVFCPYCDWSRIYKMSKYFNWKSNILALIFLGAHFHEIKHYRKLSRCFFALCQNCVYFLEWLGFRKRKFRSLKSELTFDFLLTYESYRTEYVRIFLSFFEILNYLFIR